MFAEKNGELERKWQEAEAEAEAGLEDRGIKRERGADVEVAAPQRQPRCQRA